jgi:holo-[acyl-carrier protein] synthase
MIYGVGTDLVEVSRIEKIIQRWGDRFITKVYSPDEIDYCQKKAFPPIHFAARFAVKESFLKSLGIGLGMGVGLKDIELINHEKGNPSMKLHNRAGDMLRDNGVTAVHVSLTHTRNYASAVVILEKK